MAGKMLVERTIFCLWRAGRDAPPRGGPDRGKRMGDERRQGRSRTQERRIKHGGTVRGGGRQEPEAMMGFYPGCAPLCPFQGGWRQRRGNGGCRNGRMLHRRPGKEHTGPGDVPPGRSRRAGWSGSPSREAGAFRMGPQAAPASDARSPADIGSDAGGALRSVIRYCGVSEGAQSGARSSKAV